MFSKDKDILTGEETYSGEHTEELEYYNMDLFEKKIIKKLNILEEKMDTILAEVEDNQHRLKGIQFQFTRALIIRLIKLAFITFVIFYAYNNFVSPMITGASSRYFQAESALNRFDTARNSDQSIWESLKGLFPNAGNALDSVRPNVGTSTVEN